MIPKYPFPRQRGQISRAHLTHITLALLFLIWNLYRTLQAVQTESDELQVKIFDSCTELEDDANQFMIVPQILANKTTETTVRLVKATVKKTLHMLGMTIRLGGEAIAYIVESYRAIVVCLIQSIVDVMMDLINQTKGQVLDGLDQAGNAATNGINTATNSVASAANTVIHGIDFLGLVHNDPVPVNTKLSLPALTDQTRQAVANFHIPTMEELILDGDLLIKKPFNDLADLVESSGANILGIDNNALDIHMNIPRLQFCQNIDLHVIDDMAGYFEQVLKICMGLVALTIVTCALFHAYMIRIDFGIQTFLLDKQLSTEFGTGVILDKDVSIQFAHNLRHPISSNLSRKVADLFRCKKINGRNNARQRCRWFFEYVSHNPSLLCMLVGTLGIVTGAIQLHVIDQVQNTYIPQLRAEITNQTLGAVDNMNYGISQYTTKFITDTNNALTAMEDDINGKAFKPIEDANKFLNTTIINFINSAVSFVENTMHLNFLAPFLNKATACILIKRITKLADFMDMLTSFRVDLPKLSPDLMQFNLVHMNSTIYRSQVRIFGGMVEYRGKNGSTQSRHVDGYLGKFVNVWQERVEQQMFLSKWTFMFSMIVVGQGLLGLVYMFIV